MKNGYYYGALPILFGLAFSVKHATHINKVKNQIYVMPGYQLQPASAKSDDMNNIGFPGEPQEATTREMWCLGTGSLRCLRCKYQSWRQTTPEDGLCIIHRDASAPELSGHFGLWSDGIKMAICGISARRPEIPQLQHRVEYFRIKLTGSLWKWWINLIDNADGTDILDFRIIYRPRLPPPSAKSHWFTTAIHASTM